MRGRTLLSLDGLSWGLSLGVHLALFGGFLILCASRASDLSLLELDLAWTPSIPAGKAGLLLEEEWRRPDLPVKRESPPPSPKQEDPAVPEPPAEGPAGAGEGEARNLAQVERLPSFLQRIKPQYPVEAKAANVEGVVILQVDIDATGAVKKVVLLKGLGHGCDEAAMEAAKNSTFTPALQAGSPVPVTYPLTYRFQLDQ